MEIQPNPTIGYPGQSYLKSYGNTIHTFSSLSSLAPTTTSKMPPATTPKKRVLLSTNTGPKSRRKKMKNFCPAEDQALCRAYENQVLLLALELIRRVCLKIQMLNATRLNINQ
jgi:hypothetical protein